MSPSIASELIELPAQVLTLGNQEGGLKLGSPSVAAV